MMMTSIAQMEAAERKRKAEAAKALREAKAKAERDLGRWLIERANADRSSRDFDERIDHAKAYVEAAESAWHDEAERREAPYATEHPTQ